MQSRGSLRGGKNNENREKKGMNKLRFLREKIFRNLFFMSH